MTRIFTDAEKAILIRALEDMEDALRRGEVETDSDEDRAEKRRTVQSLIELFKKAQFVE